MSLLKKLFLTGSLLAAVLVMAAPAPAQNWDGRLWKPYQPEQFGGQRRPKDGFYGGVEAIIWNISGMKHIAPWSDSLTFSELGSDFRVGTRATVGNRYGHHGWRVSYYGISGLGESISRQDTVDWATNGNIDQYGINNLYLITDWIDVQTQTVSVKSKTSINNLDLGWTYRTHPFSWGNLELYAGVKYWDLRDELRFADDSRHNVYRYSFWEGWDYTPSNYSITFGDANGRLVVLSLGTTGTGTSNSDLLDDNPTPLSLSIARIRELRTKNRATGPNLGVNLTRQNRRWTFGLDASVFLGVNGQTYIFDERGEVSFLDNTNNRYARYTSTSGTSQGGERDAENLSLSDLRGLQLISSNISGLSATYHRQHRTVFSPGVSMQLSAKWQWTDAIGVKLSFDSTVIDNVARSTDLVATARYAAPETGSTTPVLEGYDYKLRSKGETVLLYGVTIGLEFRR